MNENQRRHAARALLCAGLIGTGALAFTTPVPAQEAQPTAAQASEVRQQYAIPAGDLGKALDMLAEQNRLQIGYQPQHVTGKTAPALEGEYSLQEALSLLLGDSGLEAQFVSDKAIVVRSIVDAGADSGNASSGTGEASAFAQAAVPDPDTEPGVNVTGGPTTANVEISRQGGIEEIIVTGQKKEERIQDVPIAISAFSMEDLDKQKIEGGFDLLKGVPNVTFSKSNFSGYNFQIRGIGTQAVSASTDPGVAIAFNNTTLIVNRLFEQEYVDIERVEVLRGPQGTLYGRNATSGVVNVISAKPQLGVEEGEIKLETGNFSAQRLRGHYNLPLGDTLALRAAYASTVRDGYGTNLAATDPTRLFGDDVRKDVDGRDLWTGRLTVGWEPDERTRVNLMWERFKEDDNRVRTSKQLCHRDDGIDDNGFAAYTWITDIGRAGTSQGCKAGSLYSDGAFGTPNGASLPYVGGLFWGTALGGLAFVGKGQAGLGINPFFDVSNLPIGLPPEANAQFGTRPQDVPCDIPFLTETTIMFPINLCTPDPYAGQMQPRDLRTIYSQLEPRYQADADIFELSVDVALSDFVTFSSQTVYARDEYFATQDYNRYSTFPIFNDSTQACGETVVVPGVLNLPDCLSGAKYADGFYYDLTPGGVYTDPQLGASNSLVAQDLSEVSSEQYNQELRLVSSFDGPVNFSLGANYTRFKTMNDYYVFINAASLLTNFFPFNTHLGCYQTSKIGTDPCIYVDPNPLGQHNGEGHNYFRSANPYELRSSALFGELYWSITETLKLTFGARMTWDEKRFTPIPSQLLLADYRLNVPEGAGPDACNGADPCQLRGTGVGGRGSPPNPDIIQQWREPTGRFIVDWKPQLDLAWLDETLVYASLARGYKGGGANPPTIAPPAGTFSAEFRTDARPTFEPEYVNAFEVGTKNTLFGGGMILNFGAFYYDYSDYQVSKIVDRSAANENFDAKVWGLELEAVLAPTPDTLFNATVGYLRTSVADGERSIDIMDRTQGGNQFWVTRMPNPAFDPDAPERAEADYVAGLTAPADQRYLAFDRWIVIKPWITYSSNCIAPFDLLEPTLIASGEPNMTLLCPTGNLAGQTYGGGTEFGGSFVNPVFGTYAPERGDAPNNGAGFFADLGGNDLPNAPRFTVALGAQHTTYLPAGWDLTGRVDWYWQDQSYARIYNTEYDRLRSWTNTNFSVWLNQPQWGLKIEAYVKNAFNEAPITGTFLNSDDSGLTTNVFTLDPRLIGVSVTKRF